MTSMQIQLLAILLLPLAAAIVVGLSTTAISRKLAHRLTIGAVGVAFLLAAEIAYRFIFENHPTLNITLYTWAQLGSLKLQVGFLIDSLSATMMAVVTFVSFMVHIYTIGYMQDDPGYQRFFAYISLFTFAMLALVMSNNFLQLFFGWEAVGLVSYLLIGFWYKKPSAIFANLKAFLVNRVGDLGFLLGIAGVYLLFGSFDYAPVFAAISNGFDDQILTVSDNLQWSLLTFTCIGLFIGAMGKSAQVPLHVWLPDSMEGPTPISALIHAATMVTAGVFMVARMSPLFEQSEVALNVILVIGATTAFFMGLLGIIQNDIKRVVAYSTLSQLGYMVVALGASAYSIAIFHLVTHAFFKALLFLAAGSVIIAMHHEQDIRKMGGLRKYLPITYATSLIGTLALVGTPFFSGFYSKEGIIEAVHHSQLEAASYAYYCVLLGVFVTSLYSFRMFFLVFHTKERMDGHTREHLHEPSWVVWLPLVLLAIPSVLIGYTMASSVVDGQFFADAIFVAENHRIPLHMIESYAEPAALGLHGFTTLPFWLMIAGAFTAWMLFVWKPQWADALQKLLKPIYLLLDKKYFFDHLYINGFTAGGIALGRRFWQWIDVTIIDGWMVNGSAKMVASVATRARAIQSGYLYHYVAVMVVGLLVFLGWSYWQAIH